jgi:hypothetical protein
MPDELNEDELLIAVGGTVYAAPVGTAAPTDIATAFDAVWRNIGYVSDAGVTVDPGMTVGEIRAWQSAYPIRRHVTAQTLRVAMQLQQWNQDTIKLAFGGGTFEEAGGITTYTPPGPEEIYERALAIEALDGIRTFRWIFPRGMNVDLGETVFTRAGLALLPISYDVIGAAGQVPWTFITDDENLALTAGS